MFGQEKEEILKDASVSQGHVTIVPSSQCINAYYGLMSTSVRTTRDHVTDVRSLEKVGIKTKISQGAEVGLIKMGNGGPRHPALMLYLH